MPHTATTTLEKSHKAKLIRRAVRQTERTKKQSLLDQLFAQLFSGLVYSQIWEDPLVDLEAMELNETHHIVTIASGGCNVMNYLVANPAKITAVDLNRAHIALTRTKACAARALTDHTAFYNFFAVPNRKENSDLYDLFIKPNLDQTSKNYWHGRDKTLRRRSRYFTDNIYHHGLLGRFIGLCHLITKFYGINFNELLNAKTIEEQTAFFNQKLSPLLDKKLITKLTSHPASLYGLGIPPAQYTTLAECAGGDMAEVLRQRLRKLCCDYAIKQNYFAWQAFGRSYDHNALNASTVEFGNDNGALPPYLQIQNFNTIKSNAKNIVASQISITDKLNSMNPATVDRVVLLDAQDWMDDNALNELWAAITRSAKPGARVIFRTAGIETILPGRVRSEILTRWTYQAERSLELAKKDRSAIYGGFHLYHFNG